MDDGKTALSFVLYVSTNDDRHTVRGFQIHWISLDAMFIIGSERGLSETCTVVVRHPLATSAIFAYRARSATTDTSFSTKTNLYVCTDDKPDASATSSADNET